MQLLMGGTALSDFRLANLLARLGLAGDIAPAPLAVHGYCLVLADELDAAGEARLAGLLGLDDTPAPLSQAALAAGGFIVGPRPGTISPWSSKATDILRNCGLTTVQRIERVTCWLPGAALAGQLPALQALAHDRMTQAVYPDIASLHALFEAAAPGPLGRIALGQDGAAALAAADARLGLALSAEEIDYLLDAYAALGRDPTDVELMMFAQANSEHCRHKIFNADWTIDEQAAGTSLFAMIRNTAARAPERLLSAYSDNAAVARGYEAERFFRDPDSKHYDYRREPVHLLAKVETHNHPTAIAPYPGAATGAGGEIRDEAATGRGARAKAALTGFSVSNLRIPGFTHEWEFDAGRPGRIASALDIMLEGPIGAAAFNNEFGRPALCGYFRSLETPVSWPGGSDVRGYHKPIMLAGGVGNIRQAHVSKGRMSAEALLVVLGGPAMLIGLGGGAASSVSAGSSDADLDFASVQRANPEMQRRCQEVIDSCWALGEANPVVSIHDVGAGGLSNALPELLHDSGRGGDIDISAIPRADTSLSPLELWCNESQERYVLALEPTGLAAFGDICERERCPFAVVGRARGETRLTLAAPGDSQAAIDIPMEVMLGKVPRMHRHAHRARPAGTRAPPAELPVETALARVLSLPAVADKRFLITIGDRTVTGLVARDQMVGRWQIPVADCAVTAAGYRDYTGEAMAMGERTPLAMVDAAAAARMAVGEAITNLASARIMQLEDTILSANWMAAAGHANDDAALFDAVQAVGMELCPALGIAIPVGKDSLSMKTLWQDAAGSHSVTAPVSLIVSAFAPVVDVRRTLTPELQLDDEPTVLVLVDAALGRQRLGCSALAQVCASIGDDTPDLDVPAALRDLFAGVQALNEAGHVLACHDRSDGGLIVTVLEMALASRLGVTLTLAPDAAVLPALFCEELGVVLQVRASALDTVRAAFAGDAGLQAHVRVIGRVEAEAALVVRQGEQCLLQAALSELQAAWSATSHRLQRLRDNPDCADEEYQSICDAGDPGLSLQLAPSAAPLPGLHLGRADRPAVAILREQGVNGHNEMAAAFDAAGFRAVDVHMSDIIAGRQSLAGFTGLAACGGFSYGDVLGAGGGWAASVRFNEHAAQVFSDFFARPDSFTLGVCNGCQMLARLRDLIPGAAHWPRFLGNRSEQFEARLVMVEVLESPSIVLRDMAGSRLPVAVAHGEGRVAFNAPADAAGAIAALRYVDNRGDATERYPANPNGSAGGLTGFTSSDGRATIMMPHPERLFRSVQYSWLPAHWRGEQGPWLRMFQNARLWVG